MAKIPSVYVARDQCFACKVWCKQINVRCMRVLDWSTYAFCNVEEEWWLRYLDVHGE